MIKSFKFLSIVLVCLISCQVKQDNESKNSYSVYPVGAMRDAMWKGELWSKISFDSIKNKKGLYGLGPLTGLKGEILISDGKIFISQVLGDSNMKVLETDTGSAPFFVYTNIEEWEEYDLPSDVLDISSLEKYIDNVSQNHKRPFGFRLSGSIEKAKIHIQNLPSGMKVSSPQEAHTGQVTYEILDENVESSGFFQKNIRESSRIMIPICTCT